MLGGQLSVRWHLATCLTETKRHLAKEDISNFFLLSEHHQVNTLVEMLLLVRLYTLYICIYLDTNLLLHIFQVIGAKRCHVVTQICINPGSGNGLLPDSTKPLPELMLCYHQYNFWHTHDSNSPCNSYDINLQDKFHHSIFEIIATFPRSHWVSLLGHSYVRWMWYIYIYSYIKDAGESIVPQWNIHSGPVFTKR